MVFSECYGTYLQHGHNAYSIAAVSLNALLGLDSSMCPVSVTNFLEYLSSTSHLLVAQFVPVFQVHG